MQLKELNLKIRAFAKADGVTLTDLEKHFKMPRNHLSTMLNGTRHFPAKWQRKLAEWIDARKKTTRKKKAVAKEQTELPDEPLADDQSIGTAVSIDKPRKLPPPGLTKPQQIRWHRENNQTLQ